MNASTGFLMTRQRTWTLTAVSVALFILLSGVFADGLIRAPLWNSEDWISSPLITYALIAVILLAGWYQAQQLPATGVLLRVGTTSETPGQVQDPLRWQLLLGNVFFALIWLPIRFFVGREWVSAGWHKVTDPAWTGDGTTLQAYWQRAVAIPEQGRPPITYDWFRQFLQYMLDHGWYTWFAKLVAWGEAPDWTGTPRRRAGRDRGLLRHRHELQLHARRHSLNQSRSFRPRGLLVLAWKVAGYWGLDRWLLPALGTPWQHETLVENLRRGQ